MGWTVLPYLLATGGSVTDTDMSAVTDPEFTRRNSHFIFTEDYKLMGAIGAGATITRLNLSIATFNAIGKHNVWPLNLTSANELNPPRVAWYYPQAPMLPQNEEVQFLVTDGASENACAALIPMTPGHTRNIPPNQLMICVRATCSLTQVAGGWSAAGALTMEQTLRGGVYSLIGAEVVGSGSFLFRFLPARSRFYKGRRLRPGWLCQQAIGDLPEQRMHIDPFYLGEWFRFHTFELPQLEVFSIAGSSTISHELRLYLAYLGQDEMSLLDSWVGSGWQ